MSDIYFQGKQIIIKVHAVKRAREREISYPDQVYDVLQTGKVKKFGKHGINFVKRGKEGSIIYLGEDLYYCFIIKTKERGNKKAMPNLSKRKDEKKERCHETGWNRIRSVQVLKMRGGDN